MDRAPHSKLLAAVAATTLAGVSLASVGLVATSPRGAEAPAYLRQPLTRALEHSQARLVEGIDVYVDHSSIEDPWRARTANYDVGSTHSFRQAEELASALEQMLPRYQALLETDWTPSDRFQVVVVPDLTEHRRLGEEFGDARSSYYSSFLATGHPDRPVYTLPGRTDVETLVWATHAAAQQYVDAAFAAGGLPAWIEQGLGSYFAVQWAWQFYAEELGRLVASGAAIPMETLLRAPIGAYVDRGPERVVQLGMLFTYLLHERPETREVARDEDPPVTSFADYLRAAVRGEDLDDHPFQNWLQANGAAIQRGFYETYTQ